MISILLPSRGRPENIVRLHNSVSLTAVGPWEMIVRLDEDDPSCGDYLDYIESRLLPHVRFLVGERVVLSEMWNHCWRQAYGDIFMHAGDDIVFSTRGWDGIVRAAFPPDGIAFVHGDDLGGKGSWFGTHGFLRREWVDAVGIFAPPCFSSDFTDTWFNEVANLIGRRVFVPIVTEHHHFSLGKGTLDLTHAERLVRHWKDNNEKIWADTAGERVEWADKLRKVMR